MAISVKDKAKFAKAASRLASKRKGSSTTAKPKAEAMEAVLEAELIRAVEPDPTLITAHDDDYIMGGKIVTRLGTIITLDDIVDAYFAGERILNVGPTGCGKSALFDALLSIANEPRRAHNRKVYKRNLAKLSKGAKLEDLEPYRKLVYVKQYLSCGGETRKAEIIGDVDIKYDAEGKKFVDVVFGALTLAWTLGHSLLVDEVDKPDPAVWADAHQMLDDRTLSTDIYINGQVHIVKHPRFRIYGTANQLQGECASEYTSGDVQDTAFLNRFGSVIRMDYLDEDIERDIIIKKTGVRKDAVEKMVSFANKTRENKKSNIIDTCVSTRDLLAWGRATNRYEKRYGTHTSLSDFWKKIVYPASAMSFIERLSNPTTAQKMIDDLDLR